MAWSVFLLDDKFPLPTGEIGRLVQQVAGGFAYDHVQRVNLHHGWVARGLGEGQADTLVKLLGSSGFRALKKDEERLLKLEKKFKVQRALLLEDALYLQVGFSTELQSAPWPGITVVSIGSVVSRRLKEVPAQPGTESIAWGMGVFGVGMVTGVPVGLFSGPPELKRKVLEEIVEEAVLVHLIFAQPPFVVEIRPREFDYGYLGPRMAGTSKENFLLLVEDLTRLAAGAHWTGITRTFLETGKLAYDFKDPGDFFRYNLWITEVAAAAGRAQ